MTREEIKNLIGGMIVAYPSYKPQNMELTVGLWQEMLKDYSYKECMLSLQSYIATDTSGFAPSIGAIIQHIPRQQTSLNESEAWSLVSRALRNSTYNSLAEYEKLPELVKRAVGSPNMLYAWAIDENYNESVVSSNFMRAYRTEVKRAEEFEKLPNTVKLALKECERIGQTRDDGQRNNRLLQTSEE